MNKPLPTQLQAWIDGELNDADARQVEAWVNQDPEARQFCDELRGFSQLLRSHEPVRTVPETRDFYWSAIRRGIERQEAAENRKQAPGTPSASRRGSAWWIAWILPAGAFALAALLFFGPAGGRRAPRQAIAGHKIESPDVGMTSVTFYSAQESMTVVWLGKADVL